MKLIVLKLKKDLLPAKHAEYAKRKKSIFNDFMYLFRVFSRLSRAKFSPSNFVLILVLLFAFVSSGFAQTPEITRPDDRLPFMQKEQTAAAPAEPSNAGLMLKSFGAMLIIIGLIFFGAWGLKKFGFGKFKSNDSSDSPNLTILSTLSVGTNCSLSVVQFGQRTLLVGSTPQSFTLLADETNEPDFSTAASRSVAEMLAEETSFADELEAKIEYWEKGGKTI